MKTRTIIKDFWMRHRKSVRVKALYSSATISLFLYIIVRGFTFDFPMTWAEEILLFVKIGFTGTAIISLATIGCASLYRVFVKLRRG